MQIEVFHKGFFEHLYIFKNLLSFMEMFFYQRPLFIFTIFFLSLNGVFGWGGSATT